MADFKYEITEDFGKFSDSGNGWTKELKLIKYGSGNPKLDIRSWSVDENGNKKMSKGITLNKEEALALKKLLDIVDLNTLPF